MSGDFHRGNIGRLIDCLRGKHLQAAVLEDASSLFYFTGFETSVHKGIYAVIPVESDPFVVMQELEAVLFREVGAFKKVVLRGHKDPLGDLLAALKEHGVTGRIGVDPGRISGSMYQCLAAADELALVDIGDDLTSLRYAKCDTEISRIRTACQIAVEAMEVAVRSVKPGRTELEIAAEVVRSIMHQGALLGFEPVIQTGSRGSLPNAFSSEARIRRGDFVTIDLGVRYMGYCSDICRTTVCGIASEEQKKLLRLVRNAQESAIQEIRPGIPAAQIDAAAREVIKAAGHDSKFIHRVGHGVGCEIHEKPFLGPDHPELLEPGVVVSVEPGVYDPSFGGVRIEDNILVTDVGFEVLTRSLDWDVGAVCGTSLTG